MSNKYIDELLADIDNESLILPGEHNGFLLNLMVLSSYIIQADTKIMHSEMEFMRNFTRENFGEERKVYCEKLLMQLFAKSKQFTQEVWRSKIEQCVREMTHYTDEEQRMLMLNFLIRIVKADGNVDYREIETLRDAASWLEIELQASEKIDNLNNNFFWPWTV